MSRAAIKYAKAILDIAQTSGKADAVKMDMNSIVTAIADTPELKHFLTSPIIKIEYKKSALSEIFSNVQAETNSLFELINENKRHEILEEIAIQYNRLYDESKGIEVAKVTTALPITPELETKVLAKIAEFSNKKITIHNIVDPEIIGGFILRVGDQQYNASVASKLSELRREFSN